MATGNKFNCYVADVHNGLHNHSSDVIKAMLTNVAPLATNTVFSNITEIAAGNGYSAGGATCSLTSSAQVSGVYSLILLDGTWTASGGSIGPFRYAVIYNSTNTGANKPLICWFDYGSNITITNGNSFATLFNSVTGVLQDQ